MLTLAALGWAADIYRNFGLLLINEQFNAFVLAIALALVYLTVARRRGAIAVRRPGTTSRPARSAWSRRSMSPTTTAR